MFPKTVFFTSCTMISCVVYGCTNNSITSDSSITYHTFPENELAQKWVEACGWQSNTLDLEMAHICSIHFNESAYDSEIKMVDFVACYTKTLKDDAMPTLYLPHTQIIIKDGSLDLGDGVVVYTINSSDSNDGITTISLEDSMGEKQIFELQPSTSHVKLEEVIELHEDSLKNEVLDGTEKYDNVKNYPDLYLVQAYNKNLKRKIQKLEEELKVLEKDLEEKQDELTECENEYDNLKTQTTNKNMLLPQQDQKVILSKVFSEAQIKILFGKKKVYWTNDDMAVGYIIRHLGSKRCYNYLTKTLNIPLPGVSSIKRWVTTKKTKRIRR